MAEVVDDEEEGGEGLAFVKPKGLPKKPRLGKSRASVGAELDEMRRKLGQFMLGGDMSGGQAGTHAALTLSNAITNLSVGCWSQVAELEPLPAANLVKWRQQVK